MMIKSFLPQGSRPVYYYVAVEDPSLLFRDRWARELAALGSIARLCFRGGMKDEFFIWCWNRLGTSLEQAWNMLGTSLEQAGTGLEQAWNKLEQAWNRLGTSLEQAWNKLGARTPGLEQVGTSLEQAWNRLEQVGT